MWSGAKSVGYSGLSISDMSPKSIDPFLAIHSQYWPVMKVCERGTFFSINGIQTGYRHLFCQNDIPKGKGLNLGPGPTCIELCREPPEITT